MNPTKKRRTVPAALRMLYIAELALDDAANLIGYYGGFADGETAQTLRYLARQTQSIRREFKPIKTTKAAKVKKPA